MLFCGREELLAGFNFRVIYCQMRFKPGVIVSMRRGASHELKKQNANTAIFSSISKKEARIENSSTLTQTKKEARVERKKKCSPQALESPEQPNLSLEPRRIPNASLA
jgi:hypothetical protein